jgi:hypothetical protein
VKTLRERNIQILEMRRAGCSYRAVGEHFGRSPSLAWHVVRRLELQEELSKQSQALLEEIRKSDDLARKWDAIALVNGLLLPSRITKVLVRHLAAQGVREISLLELMDMLINADDPDEFFGVAVGLRIKHIGGDSFCSIVDRLMEVDLGANAKSEWARRIEILSRDGAIEFREAKLQEIDGETRDWLPGARPLGGG